MNSKEAYAMPACSQTHSVQLLEILTSTSHSLHAGSS